MSTADEAVAAAARLGYPVVLKSTSPLLRHQGGVGGVRVDLRSETSVRDAFDALAERLAPLGADAFVVQKMATPGVPASSTPTEDPLFGPVVGFSVAGPPTELLGDIAHRIPPLTDVDVSDLISSVRAAPLLHGHRGATPVDRARPRRPHRAGRRCWPTTCPRWPSWTSTRSTPTPAASTSSGPRSCVAPASVRKDTGRRALP